jgi:hypothetical protein
MAAIGLFLTDEVGFNGSVSIGRRWLCSKKQALNEVFFIANLNKRLL